ncbi:KN motif and ankyrin repeat domain-containing protein 1 [Halotydeus destructor]|nr:KN motif and ankyrin repeat domain-containing protein 1 [Halotydeus destructor]
MLAASHGHLTTCQLLIESGAAINVQDNDGSTALMCAAEHGRSEVVRLLLSHPECDTNVLDNDGSTALSIAMESGNKDIGLTLYASTSMLSRGSSVYASLRRSQSNGNSSDFKRTGSLRGRIAVAERTIPQAPKNGSKPRSPYQPLASD